ncbi:MAG TPA: PD-(D/E)XK nuclease domain-containing protein [Rickettsia endosymbiont of Bembidion nr. Transversale]|nr:PD-(D/E)XK nuclease domain-containing protein [Rickettsia endosymbiont of Bembidion nr. Transversale]
MKLLTQGEIDKFFDKFKRYLIASTSYHDLHYERDYHNLIGGIFAPLSSYYIIESNIESGYGRFDHRLISRRDKGDKAFIIEYKVGKEEKELVKLAQEGLKQITDKAYTTTIDNYPHIKKIFKIAVAFCGKEAVMEYSF